MRYHSCLPVVVKDLKAVDIEHSYHCVSPAHRVPLQLNGLVDTLH